MSENRERGQRSDGGLQNGQDDTCATCWHCQPGTPRKGYCMKWGISVEYSESACKMHKEASERRKKEIARMQTRFEDHGYVEVKE